MAMFFFFIFWQEHIFIRKAFGIYAVATLQSSGSYTITRFCPVIFVTRPSMPLKGSIMMRNTVASCIISVHFVYEQDVLIVNTCQFDEAVHGFCRDDKGWVLAIWRGVEVVVVECNGF